MRVEEGEGADARAQAVSQRALGPGRRSGRVESARAGRPGCWGESWAGSYAARWAERKRGKRGWAGIRGSFFFLKFLFCFLFLKPFPNKILNANKFKPEANNTK